MPSKCLISFVKIYTFRSLLVRFEKSFDLNDMHVVENVLTWLLIGEIQRKLNSLAKISDRSPLKLNLIATYNHSTMKCKSVSSLEEKLFFFIFIFIIIFFFVK